MSSVLDLPYDVLREIFTRLSAVDVLHFLSTSRMLYYPLIDDDSTWYIFCAPYGVTDTSWFGKRSFRIIYGRLLHRYGPLLGLWCSDCPFAGNIIEFHLVPDRWLRRGELIIVGDIWELARSNPNAQRPYFPTYIEFVQIGFVPWKKSTPQTKHDVQISWHLRSERDLGFLVHNGIPPPWVRMDGDGRLATPSLHAIAPTKMTVDLSNLIHPPVVIPEMTASVPWYDGARRMPCIPQDPEPPPFLERGYSWYYSPTIRYAEGAEKPASIAFFPPPLHVDCDVRLPELHNPQQYFSRDFETLIPRYYPMLFPSRQGENPGSPQWNPESLVGLWLGDYGPHGTECLFLEHDATQGVLRAWKITGDSHVPRGACSWDANLNQPSPGAGPGKKVFEGAGTTAQRGFL
ncbi:hypothetical protein C8Q77DRAFT_1092862 [Trametes polyzona]|nr:hypothetical protein C8Q77DRAFT_1092862 [Trametes polyzona]